MDRELVEYRRAVAFFAVDWPPVVYLRRKRSDGSKPELDGAANLGSISVNTLVQLLQRRSSAVIRALGRISRVLKARKPEELAMNIIAPIRTETAGEASRAQTVDMKLEVVVLPVSVIDRAKEFYGRLGWRLDADFSHGDERVIQFTPPGSPCSVVFGTNQSSVPGSVQNSFLIVSDIQAARDDLVGRGIEVGEVFHYAAGPAPFGGQVSGPAPDRMSYGSYATFKDPDGNGWLLQEVTTRFPGRIDSNTTSFASPADLASAVRRASVAHGEHEKRTDGLRHENWPDWYAEYMVAEQAGRELPI